METNLRSYLWRHGCCLLKLEAVLMARWWGLNLADHCEKAIILSFIRFLHLLASAWTPRHHEWLLLWIVSLQMHSLVRSQFSVCLGAPSIHRTANWRYCFPRDLLQRWLYRGRLAELLGRASRNHLLQRPRLQCLRDCLESRRLPLSNQFARHFVNKNLNLNTLAHTALAPRSGSFNPGSFTLKRRSAPWVLSDL